MTTKKRNLAILMFDDVEVLDFAGPFEVFSVTSELNNDALFNVYLVASAASDNGPIRAVNGLSVNPDYALAEAPTPDILLIPGGAGSRAVVKDAATIEWVKRQATHAELVLSVCTGALVLAKAGLLAGLRATTHHEVFDTLERLAPTATICPNDRFTDNGRVLTSGGISAGIDMSLHVVEKLHGPEIRDKTQVYMEYGDWRGRTVAH